MCLSGGLHAASPALVGTPAISAINNYTDGPVVTSVTNPGGTNLVLIVRVLMANSSSGTNSTNEISDITFGSQSLTQYDTVVVTTSNGPTDLETWYLVNPDPGTMNLTVSWSTPNL
ncbi:MAG TPA: hypothetical protein VK786_02935, partial [bacterium]|nr:hypothetical protein [bacterium]